MKSFTVLCLVLGAISAVVAAPNPDDFALLVRPRAELDLMADSRKLIEDLVGNLRKSAQDAIGAVGNFTEGIRDEARKVREKIFEDIEQLRLRVKDAVDNVLNRIGNTTAGVRECVDSRRNEASQVFNETVSKSLACVDERVVDIGKQVEDLGNHATTGMDYGNKAIEEMRKCPEDNNNLFTVGACLAGVAFQVETKSLGFGAQMGAMIARINLSIATLPAALELCAGSQVVQAGLAAGRIVIDMGGCAASTIFNGMIGNSAGSTSTASIDEIATSAVTPPTTSLY